tara:strand:+ start:5823 stop:6953 length:1131 start_codon:yes stop_codon:yes gene_type:complete
MPSSRVQRKQSIVQNIDNNNGGGMKKQGGPVTTGNTHTYWKPALTKTIIKGKSAGNDGSTFEATTFGPIAFTANTHASKDFTANTHFTKTFTGNVTNGNSGISNINIDATALLRVGQSISGTGIPSGATILSITNASTIIISKNATSGGTGITFTRAASPVITNVSIDATALLAVGQSISGTGITGSATITSITDANTITISKNAASDQNGTTLTRAASAVLTNVTEVTGKLEAGRTLSGTGIASGATISSFNIASKTLTMSAAATADGTGVTITGSGTDRIEVTKFISGRSIFVGQEITGPGIPANTKVSALGTGIGGVGTYTLDNTITATADVRLEGKATKHWNNYGKTYTDNPYRPFNIFRSGTGAKFRFQYP